MDDDARWWGADEIEVGLVGRWSIGPLALVGERRPFEWRLSWHAAREPSLHTVNFEIFTSETPHEGHSDVRRFALGGERNQLVLKPRLSDRSIVARPSTPVTVLGGSTVNVFVTTPLWLEVSLASDDVLVDIPTLRLSDTWFGDSPRSGELCYASRTQARLDPDRLVYHPVRAMTRICINNALKHPLMVERVKIPVPNLSLFKDKEGHLWTQAVHVERHTANQPSKIWFETPSLLISDTVELINPARKPIPEGLLERAVNALIG